MKLSAESKIGALEHFLVGMSLLLCFLLLNGPRINHETSVYTSPDNTTVVIYLLGQYSPAKHKQAWINASVHGCIRKPSAFALVVDAEMGAMILLHQVPQNAMRLSVKQMNI